VSSTLLRRQHRGRQARLLRTTSVRRWAELP